MSATLREIEFDGCTVRVWNAGTYTETIFPDGTKCPALPTGTEEQARVAEELGYGDDVAALCREHELLHTLLAEARGLEYSPTLWDVAHGVPQPVPVYHYHEEHDVLALQRMLNEADPGPLYRDRVEALSRELDLPALMARARRLLRAGAWP